MKSVRRVEGTAPKATRARLFDLSWTLAELLPTAYAGADSELGRRNIWTKGRGLEVGVTLSEKI